MRIAIFTDTFYPQINGVSNTLAYLCAHLDQNGIEHLVFAPEYEEKEDDVQGAQRENVLRFKGVRPSIYPECSIAFPLHPVVVDALRRFAPDVVHIVTEAGIGLAGLQAARWLGLPIVMSYHTNFDTYLDFYNLKYLARPLWAYMKWFHSYAQVTLCPSRDTVRDLAARGFDRLGIWSRGIDTQRFSPAFYSETAREQMGGGSRKDEDKTVFLYVGRIAKEKGLDTLADAIKLISPRHTDTLRFVFTGDGPYLAEFRERGIPNALFTGVKKGRELSEIYASADAFLFPSGTETFGNVALEAMASGLPVVCVDSGGVTDFARHGENALVCRHGDAHSIAAGIEQMCSSHTRSILRKGAQDTAEERSWQSIFDGLFRSYDKAAQPAAVHAGRVAG
ncbi:MAG: glycosyltransferase family 4 protein [Acetanaerobacterium sp.]